MLLLRISAASHSSQTSDECDRGKAHKHADSRVALSRPNIYENLSILLLRIIIVYIILTST